MPEKEKLGIPPWLLLLEHYIIKDIVWGFVQPLEHVIYSINADSIIHNVAIHNVTADQDCAILEGMYLKCLESLGLNEQQDKWEPLYCTFVSHHSCLDSIAVVNDDGVPYSYLIVVV